MRKQNNLSSHVALLVYPDGFLTKTRPQDDGQRVHREASMQQCGPRKPNKSPEGGLIHPQMEWGLEVDWTVGIILKTQMSQLHLPTPYTQALR